MNHPKRTSKSRSPTVQPKMSSLGMDWDKTRVPSPVHHVIARKQITPGCSANGSTVKSLCLCYHARIANCSFASCLLNAEGDTRHSNVMGSIVCIEKQTRLCSVLDWESGGSRRCLIDASLPPETLTALFKRLGFPFKITYKEAIIPSMGIHTH